MAVKNAPLVDITIGGMSCPEVEYNPANEDFWLTWRAGNIRIDVTLDSVEALRELTRACLEAAEVAHAAHHQPVPRV
jgi:hypothetical protein